MEKLYSDSKKLVEFLKILENMPEENTIRGLSTLFELLHEMRISNMQLSAKNLNRSNRRQVAAGGGWSVYQMKRLLYIFTILIVLFGVIAFGIGAGLRRKEMENMRTDKVGGLIATWKYVEREIDLDYFYQLGNTTTYKQMEEEIGEPNGVRESGEEGEYDKVGMLLLCSQDEVLEKIYPR